MKADNLIWFKDFGDQDLPWRLLTDQDGNVIDDLGVAIDLVRNNLTGTTFWGQVGLADTPQMKMDNAVWDNL